MAGRRRPRRSWLIDAPRSPVMYLAIEGVRRRLVMSHGLFCIAICRVSRRVICP
jgi:hypothetical protein